MGRVCSMHIIIRKIKTIRQNPYIILLYFKRYVGTIKLYLAYILIALCGKRIKNRNIWLISEKGTEARDNGYWFYKYVKNVHPEINVHYVIAKNAIDRKKIEEQDIISQHSFKHYLYCLASKVNINSQAFGAIPKPPEYYFPIYKKLRRKDQVLVYLKHGIIKDEMTHALDYSNADFDFVCCAAEKELSFVKKTYGYPDDNIKTVGLCRFDNLLNDHVVKKQVLIMPTHRMWLHSIDTAREASQLEKESFEKSDFYKEYSSLLSDDDLLKSIRKKEYKIVFYLHYALQSFVSCFDKFASDDVIISNREQYDVQQLLLESSLLITDYSSVFFDFAYMGKPEVFFQFDEDRYRSEHFHKGYFDYYLDGFGPVLKKKEEIICEIQRIMDNECVMDAIYKDRVNEFFTIRDKNNCKRVFDEIYRKAMTK